jgi:hypothetical protein
MGEIDSPIGKTTFQSQPMKTWSVDDASEQDFEVPSNAQVQGAPAPEVYENLTPEQANQLRREFAARAAAGGAGMPPGGPGGPDGPGPGGPSGSMPGKRRLEILLGIGRGRKDIALDTNDGKFTFSLRTLKGKEQMEVASTAETLKRIRGTKGDYIFSPSSVHVLRLVVLKHSLYAIDGIDIDLVLGQNGRSPDDRLAFREAFIDELDEGLVTHLFASYEALVEEHSAKYNLATDKGIKEVAEKVRKSGEGVGSQVPTSPGQNLP